MKAILLGDTHWGNSNDSIIFHEYFAKCYKELFKYVDSNGIKIIIQLGDLYDKRKGISFLTLHRAREIFFNECEKRGIKLYVLAGNHDCTYKNTNDVNSVQLLATNNMIVVDSEPTTINIAGTDIDFYPWINDENYNQCRELMNTGKSKIAVGHFEFNNFPMHPGQLAESGMDHKFLERYHAVYSGHYHTISSKDNVLYTGTPYELNWSDEGDPKGFWVIDLNDPMIEPEFIKNDIKLYQKIIYDDLIDIDETVDVKDKFVKLVVTNKQDQYQFDSYFAKLSAQSPYSIKVIESDITKAIATAMNSNVEFISTQAMIYHVIDEMETQINRTKLKSLISEVYSEAEELLKL